MSDYQPNLRDKVAVTICNLVLRCIATKEYNRRITFFIEYGMRSAARDTLEGNDIPPDWRPSQDTDKA